MFNVVAAPYASATLERLQRLKGIAMTSDPSTQHELYPTFFDLVGQMRAMRRLKPDPVPLSLIRKVLDAGVKAPSGMNSQPWKFLVLSERDDVKWFAKHYRESIMTRFGAAASAGLDDSDSPMVRQFRALLYQADHMHEYPVILIVCGERDWPFRVPEGERVGLAPPNYGAIYPCVQNILLACRAVGLGAAVTTMHQVFEEPLLERFAIPDEFGVVASIPMGYPMGRFGPVSRIPAEEKTFFGRWEETEPPGDSLGG